MSLTKLKASNAGTVSSLQAQVDKLTKTEKRLLQNGHLNFRWLKTKFSSSRKKSQAKKKSDKISKYDSEISQLKRDKEKNEKKLSAKEAE